MSSDEHKVRWRERFAAATVVWLAQRCGSTSFEWLLLQRAARALRKRHSASLTQLPAALCGCAACAGAWQRRVQRRAHAGRRGPLHRRDCAGSEQPRALQQPLRSTGASGSFRRTCRGLACSQRGPPGVRRGARVSDCFSRTRLRFPSSPRRSRTLRRRVTPAAGSRLRRLPRALTRTPCCAADRGAEA